MSRNRQSSNNNVSGDNPSISRYSSQQQQNHQQPRKYKRQSLNSLQPLQPSQPSQPLQPSQSTSPTSPTSSISSSSRPVSFSSPPRSPYRPMNTNPFDDNPNSTYSPKDFYSNDTNSRAMERRDSHQKKIIWNHQLEQKQRQQIQKYQQYQQLQNTPIKPNSVELSNQTLNNNNNDNNNNNNNNVNVNDDDQTTIAATNDDSRNSREEDDYEQDDYEQDDDDDEGDDEGDEYEEGENVSDLFQNVYSPSSRDFKSRVSVVSMAESVNQPTDRSASTTSSQTLFRSSIPNNNVNNNSGHNIKDSVEMNVLNDKNNAKLSKSHRPRPQAAENSPSNINNDDYPYERSKSPTRSLLSRMPTIMRNVPNAENNFPRRQKSLVRPERARDTHYRRAARPYDGSDEESKRWSVFSGNGGEDRRKSSMSLARRSSMKEPPGKRKWYKCQCPSCWMLFSRVVTFWAPPSLLSCFGMHDKLVQQAWREKIALVFIILVLCIVVGFLTFGLQTVFCKKPDLEGILAGHLDMNHATISGRVYDLKSFTHGVFSPYVKNEDLSNPDNGFSLSDLSFLFQQVNFACKDVLTPINSNNGLVLNYFPCVPVHDYDTPNPNVNPENHGCHPTAYERVDALSQFKVVGEVRFDWNDIYNSDSKYVVYNGQILDLDRFQWTVPNIQLPDSLIQIINDENDVFHGRDITHYLHSDSEKIKLAKCMQEIVKVGTIDELPISCIVTGVITYVSFIVIVSVVMVRFFLAVLFGWILSWRLGSFREETAEEIAKRERDIELWSNENNHFASARDSTRQSRFLNKSRFSTLPPPGMAPFVDRRRQDSRTNSRIYSGSGEKNFNNSSTSLLLRPMSTNSYTASSMAKDSNGRTSRPSSIVYENNNSRANSMSSTSSSTFNQLPSLNPANETRFNFPLMHTIMLVTCYSEGKQGIRTTLNSLANTDYPTSHKLIMIIADGIIFGSGNDLSTPDICLSLMTDFVKPKESVVAHSYVAIADGKKRHNMAKVYAGYYRCKDHNDPSRVQKIPIVTIVKCGGPDELDDKKPGNRGKRDSQMILMSFLQKVMFDERMTPLEYEFFNSIRAVTGVTPDYFEIVLMVDADTKIYSDSVTRMVACMSRDSSIMGLCGETKIANKKDSWVTAIQVFEYYISHHMQKAFESIFGGVTCLPGCFCMYRIKAPKGPNGYWVPILANPDIVEQYSENIVDSLHKKNLLLLGEDRYLSTLMLRAFPKRKMVFVPQAVCKTIVPDTFRVLRSQRRRWINSTVHNLLELVLIPDLCGTFCFSMQFVIFMELIGTVVLPAAITFTLYLIVISFIQKPVPYLPLALLAVVLGLPAILILLTTRKIVYVGWMLIYLLSLPIWNFVLPVYAYWHFDDFSWGQTRKVEGEVEGADHSRKEGEFDSTKIVMKRWAEWEREKQLKSKRSSSLHQQISSAPMSPEEGFPNSLRVSTMNGGNEKSHYSTPSPLNPILRAGGKRATGIGLAKTRTPTDSLMTPPQLSNSSPDLSTNNSTQSDIDYNYQQNYQQNIPSNNNTNYNYNNNGNNNYGNNLPNNYEEAHLRHHNYESS